MFKNELSDKLKRIFDLKKVSFDQPSNSKEQECLFVEIEKALNSVRDGRVLSRVTGNALVWGPADKIPFGYFSKRIKQADPEDTKDLFFTDIETNVRTYQNIVQRGFSFTYFFNSQYDPATGSIDQVTLTIEETAP